MINLQYKTTSANFIILLILLVISFSNCITNEQDSCKRRIAIDETDMDSCVNAISFSIVQIDSKNRKENPNSNAVIDTSGLIGSDWFNLALGKCLVAIGNEKNCDKKSKYIPTIGERN